MTTVLADLPLTAEVEVIPWTDTYWPTMDDSFNARWQGIQTLSPLEKYDMAFNGWTPPPGFERLRPLTRDNCESGQWDPEYYEALGPAARSWSRSKGNFLRAMALMMMVMDRSMSATTWMELKGGGVVPRLGSRFLLRG